MIFADDCENIEREGRNILVLVHASSCVRWPYVFSDKEQFAFAYITFIVCLYYRCFLGKRSFSQGARILTVSGFPFLFNRLFSSFPVFPKFRWNFPRLDRLSENYRDVIFISSPKNTQVVGEEQGLSDLCDGNGFAERNCSDEKIGFPAVRKFTGTDIGLDRGIFLFSLNH